MLRKSVPVRAVTVLLLLMGFAGCDKKSSEAIVLSKEHIDAAPPIEETQSPQPSTEETPNAESEPGPDVQIRPMADDEIAVGGRVMKREVRGTSRDPRALTVEQWLVEVRLLNDGRKIRVPADRVQWEKLRENDRVKVRYRTGKYTGTVWAAEIE